MDLSEAVASEMEAPGTGEFGNGGPISVGLAAALAAGLGLAGLVLFG